MSSLATDVSMLISGRNARLTASAKTTGNTDVSRFMSSSSGRSPEKRYKVSDPQRRSELLTTSRLNFQADHWCATRGDPGLVQRKVRSPMKLCKQRCGSIFSSNPSKSFVEKAAWTILHTCG